MFARGILPLADFNEPHDDALGGREGRGFHVDAVGLSILEEGSSARQGRDYPHGVAVGFGQLFGCT